MRPRSGAPTSHSATYNSSFDVTSSSRGRPSTGAPLSSSRQRNKPHRTGDSQPLFFRHISSPELTTAPVRRWDGAASAAAAAATPQNSNNSALGATNRLCTTRSSGGRSTDRPDGGVELAEKQSLDATLHSSLSGPSFHASLLDDITAPDTETATSQPQQIDSWQKTADDGETDDINTLAVPTTAAAVTGSHAFNGAHGDAFIANSRDQGSPLPRRPVSAKLSPVEQISAHTFTVRGDKIARPRTAGSARNPASTSGNGGGGGLRRGDMKVRNAPLTRPRTARGGAASVASTEEGCEAGSSLGGRVSVAVMLPLLEEAKDATMMRYDRDKK